MVTTLMLSLLLSILVAALLVSSTSDVLIAGNEVRTSQVFYVAEAGIHRAAGWFSSRFTGDPNSGLFVLPEQNASNSSGAAGKLNYTDTPYYQKGASATTPEQTIPTSVKVAAGGLLQNVVLAGDSSNTFPATYTVTANDESGTPKTFTYNTVVSDFASHLYDQTEGEGKFTVTATLISIVPPSNGQQGTATWLLQSTGNIFRDANTSIASATLYAYISARVTAIQTTVTTQTGNEPTGVPAGVISRGKVTWTSNAVDVDSYRSSKGAYNVSLAANSYPGQIGSTNRGSRGDIRTNNDTINGEVGYIDIKNGTVTGDLYATMASPEPEAMMDPLTVTSVNNGIGGTLTASDKHYSQSPLEFPSVPVPTPPPAGAVNYSYSSKSSATLPANSNGYNNIDVSKGSLTIPPGNYGTITVDTQGTIVLGQAGVATVYNLQGFVGGAQGNIIFKGAVTINVQNTLDVGAGSSISDPSLPASAIRWNFVGGAGQTVSLGGHGMTLGVFYAPNNDLYMRGGTDFYGGIAARTIDIGGTAAIHVDEDAIGGVQSTVPTFGTTTTTVGYTATNYSLWRITQAIN